MLFFILVASVVATTFVSAAQCPEGYKLYRDGNLCINAVDQAKNFNDARAHCQGEGGDLIQIKDKATQDVVMTMINKGQHTWIGVYDDNHDKTYHYVDGSDLGSFQPWNKGEPNNYAGAEHCGHIIAKTEVWNDLGCGYKLPFVCAQEPAKCDEGYDFFEDGNLCINAVDQAKSFNDARAHCQGEGGDLIQINDKATQDFVLTKINRGKHTWIGVHDDNHDKTYNYVDGSELGSFQPWNKGEPNNYAGAEHCGHIIANTEVWNDLGCGYNLPFVCAKEAYSCQSGYHHYKNQCIKGYKVQKTFDEARTQCQLDGGELIKLQDMETQQFVKSLVGADKHFWIGVHDDNHDVTYNYVDGSPLGSFQPWNNGEPNNYGGVEHCGHVLANSNKWNDLSCGGKIYFACGQDKCAQGYHHFKGQCVKGYKEGKTFSEARVQCQKDGADLIKLQDSETEEHLRSIIGGDKHFWIGVHDDNNDVTYNYVDGSALGSFHPWNNGEPNNYSGVEHCGHVIANSDKWNDLSCGAKISFACGY